MRIAHALACLALLGLGGCTLFGGEEEEAAGQAEPPVSVIPAPQSVIAVRRVELGRTRDGVMLSAYGTAPGLGFTRPRLVARRGGAPGSDGMLDYDFIADPPPERLGLPTGSPRARSLRADAELAPEVMSSARGVRVHANEGGVQLFF